MNGAGFVIFFDPFSSAEVLGRTKVWQYRFNVVEYGEICQLRILALGEDSLKFRIVKVFKSLLSTEKCLLFWCYEISMRVKAHSHLMLMFPSRTHVLMKTEI